MSDLLSLILLIIIGYFFYWISQPDQERILGVYSQPGKWYWLKFRIMRFLINKRQKKSRQVEPGKKQEDLMDTQWGGSGGLRALSELDRKHEFLSGDQLPKDVYWVAKYGADRAVDAVFVNGSNSDGWYLTLGTAQRPNYIINLYFTVRIPGYGLFVDEDLEKNSNVKSIPSKDAWKTKSGFTLQCIKPMREWKATFKGKLRKSSGFKIFTTIGNENPKNDEPLIDAEFEFTWTNHGEYFDFDCECSPTIIGHSLAIEPWSMELFKKLKGSHQSHYEQAGHMNGWIRIGEKMWKDVKITGMRDHTIGPYRNWTEIRRYVMMFYRLDDGTVIHTSIISMPEIVFSHLEFGYVVNSEAQKVPIDRIYLDISKFAEDKHVPKKYSYYFTAGNKKYDVEYEIIDSCSFKMGLDLACQEYPYDWEHDELNPESEVAVKSTVEPPRCCEEVN